MNGNSLKVFFTNKIINPANYPGKTPDSKIFLKLLLAFCKCQSFLILKSAREKNHLLTSTSRGDIMGKSDVNISCGEFDAAPHCLH